MILLRVPKATVGVLAEVYFFEYVSVVEIVCSWCCGRQINSPWDYTYYTVSLGIVKTGTLIYVLIDPDK